MPTLRSGIAAAVLLSMVSLGCTSQVTEENRKLHAQNRELQARLDANKMQGNDTPHLSDQPALTQTPQVAKSPETQPVPPASPLPAAPAPDRPLPSIGDNETFESPTRGTTTIRLKGDTFFDSGKETLKPSAKTSLNQVAAALKQSRYAGKTIRIEGHSDSKPIKVSHWKSNQELSEARAKSVRDYLVKQGIEARLITIRGFGDTRPNPNATTDAQNRRVEVVVITH